MATKIRAQIAYEAHSERAGGKSLATGQQLPPWEKLSPEDSGRAESCRHGRREVGWPRPSQVRGMNLNAEEWRDVVGFEANYEVSSCGRVRNRNTGRILRPWIAGYCYYYVRLCQKKRAIHVLVAEAFCGPKPSLNHEVAHWDGVTTNNCATNIRWATRAENIADQRRHGTLNGSGVRGECHPRSKLSDRDVHEIR
jgi:hypothetical protein